MGDASIGEDGVLLQHMIDGLAVNERPRSAGIIGHHAAQGGAAGCRDIGSEAQAVLLDCCVQLVEHDARFHTSPTLCRIDLQKAIEILRGVDLQARTDGLAGL